MHEVVQFGQGDNYKYDFTAAHIEQVQRQPVFGGTRTNSSRLIGMDGSFNNNFRRRAPSEGGNVRLSLNLLGDGTLSDMESKLEALMAMLAWGEQRLFKQLDDGTLLWTWATVANIRPQFNEESFSYIVNGVQIDWTCPKARWYGKDGLALTEDTNGWDVPGPKVDRVTKNPGETIDIDNDGNAPAGAYVWLEAPAGNTYSNPGLTRYTSGVNVADQLVYNDTLNGGDVVALDARNHETQLNSSVVGDYDKVTYNSATWLELLPGTNTLEVEGSGAAGVIITVDCWDTYY